MTKPRKEQLSTTGGNLGEVYEIGGGGIFIFSPNGTGGASSLSSVLAIGNTADGYDIVLNDGSVLDSETSLNFAVDGSIASTILDAGSSQPNLRFNSDFDAGTGVGALITISQPTTSRAGMDLTIAAGQGGAGANHGGDLELRPGANTGGGTEGVTRLQSSSGTDRVTIDSSAVETALQLLRFASTVASPQILQASDVNNDASGDTLLINAQDVTGGGTTIAGGNLSLRAGNANSGTATTRNGGSVTVTAGFSGGSGNGGNVTISATNGVSGGDIFVFGGNSQSGNNIGGDIRFSAGDGVGTQAGGVILLGPGDGGITGAGGATTILGGTGGAISGNGGDINITSGDANSGGTAGFGGTLSVIAGISKNNAGSGVVIRGGTGQGSSSSFVGGTVSVTGGFGANNAAGGKVTIEGGLSGAVTGDGGLVEILGGTVQTSGHGGSINITGRGGLGTNKDGGDINISTGAGTGTGNDGYIVLNLATGATTPNGVIDFQENSISFVRFDPASIVHTGGEVLVEFGNIEANTVLKHSNTSSGGGTLRIIGRDATSGSNPGGHVFLVPGQGSGAGADGYVRVLGDLVIDDKLTVGGIIDPTGLNMSEQTSVPGGVPLSSTGTIWIRSIDSRPVFTDDFGVDRLLAFSTEGGIVQTLAEVLAAGNETDGYDIVLTNGSILDSDDTLSFAIDSGNVIATFADLFDLGIPTFTLNADFSAGTATSAFLGVSETTTNRAGVNLVIVGGAAGPGTNIGGDIRFTPGSPTGGAAEGKIRFQDQSGSTTYLLIDNTVIESSRSTLRFTSSVVTPSITQVSDATADAIADDFTIQAQSVTGGGTNITGGSLFLKGGNAHTGTATTNVGGDVVIDGGNGDDGTGTAGQIIVGGMSGNGGIVVVSGGTGADGNQEGGAVTLVGGLGKGNQEGGLATVQGGVGGAIGAGGFVEIRGGYGGITSGNGGDVDIFGGDAQTSGAGGDVTITGGTSFNESGGSIVILGGTPDSGNFEGGSVNIIGGFGKGNQQGGLALFQGGVGGDIGDGGNTFIQGGLGGITSGNGGTVLIRGGNAQTSGDGGDVQIVAGVGTGGQDGYIHLKSADDVERLSVFGEEVRIGLNAVFNFLGPIEIFRQGKSRFLSGATTTALTYPNGGTFEIFEEDGLQLIELDDDSLRFGDLIPAGTNFLIGWMNSPTTEAGRGLRIQAQNINHGTLQAGTLTLAAGRNFGAGGHGDIELIIGPTTIAEFETGNLQFFTSAGADAFGIQDTLVRVDVGVLTIGSDVATTGRIRGPNGIDFIVQRNAANSDNCNLISLTSGNELQIGQDTIAQGNVYRTGAGNFHIFRVGGSQILNLNAVASVFDTDINFGATFVTPVINQQALPTANGTGQTLLINAQDVTGSGTSITGGALTVRAGNANTGSATSRQGGDLSLSGGTGGGSGNGGDVSLLGGAGGTGGAVGGEISIIAGSSSGINDGPIVGIQGGMGGATGNGGAVTIIGGAGGVTDGYGGDINIISGVPQGGDGPGEITLTRGGANDFRILTFADEGWKYHVPTGHWHEWLTNEEIICYLDASGARTQFQLRDSVAQGSVAIIPATPDSGAGVHQIIQGGSAFGGSGGNGGNVQIAGGFKDGAGTPGDVSILRDSTTLLTTQASNIINLPQGILSFTSTPASSGSIRLPRTATGIVFRNQANDGNLTALGASGTNQIDLGADSGVTDIGIRSGSGGVIRLFHGGSLSGELLSTVWEISAPIFRFANTVVSPSILQETDSTADVTGDTLTINSQDVTGSGTLITGGNIIVRGGNTNSGTATDGYGGHIFVSGGTGRGTLGGKGNVVIGTTSAPNFRGMRGGMFIQEVEDLPSIGPPTNGIYVYVEGGAGKAKGTSGTITTWAPAEPHCKRCGKDAAHEWQNDAQGWKLSLCAWCMSEGIPINECIIEKYQ